MHNDPRKKEEAYDDLWQRFRKHAEILTRTNNPVTMDDVFLAMLVGQEAELRALREEIARRGS